MSGLYKLPEDGSWIDLNQIQSIQVVYESFHCGNDAIGYEEGPLIQIKFLNTDRMYVHFSSDLELQTYADALAAEINKRRGTAPYEQAQVARFALGDIIEILEPLTSANPHVKERLQTALKIARQALNADQPTDGQ